MLRTFLNNPVRKLGLDIHGVVDTYPSFFIAQAEEVIRNQGEVHIITGIPFSKEVESELLQFNKGIRFWTHYFSIETSLLERGEKYELDRYGRKQFDTTAWDKTKAIYCRLNSIDIHYDDSPEYAQYFETPIMLFMPNPVKFTPPGLFEGVRK